LRQEVHDIEPLTPLSWRCRHHQVLRPRRGYRHRSSPGRLVLVQG
jgi:hypothetical protein